MADTTILLAAPAATADRVVEALEVLGYTVTRLAPAETRPGVRAYLTEPGQDGAQVVTQYTDIAERIGAPGRALYVADGAS